MKYALILAASFFCLFSFGQTDTARIYNCSVLKTGFYSNYQEFISNSPSISTHFEITYLRISKNDSTIIGASYKLSDGTKLPAHIWGFCDGKDVFINFSPSLIAKHFWRLESLGPYPFFSYLEKNVAAMGPPLMAIATVALTASQPPMSKLRTIADNGKTRAASIKRLKVWLEPEPDLLAAFNRTGYKTPAAQGPEPSAPRYPDSYQGRISAIREYLLKLNQRLQQKSPRQ